MSTSPNAFRRGQWPPPGQTSAPQLVRHPPPCESGRVSRWLGGCLVCNPGKKAGEEAPCCARRRGVRRQLREWRKRPPRSAIRNALHRYVEESHRHTSLLEESSSQRRAHGWREVQQFPGCGLGIHRVEVSEELRVSEMPQPTGIVSHTIQGSGNKVVAHHITMRALVQGVQAQKVRASTGQGGRPLGCTSQRWPVFRQDQHIRSTQTTFGSPVNEGTSASTSSSRGGTEVIVNIRHLYTKITLSFLDHKTVIITAQMSSIGKH